MQEFSRQPLRIGAWTVIPATGTLSRGDDTVRLDARALRLLLCLAAHPGDVVSIDELLNQAWSGVIVTPDSVYQAITSLRRTLGDDPKRPTYIATVPRLGYRMVARVLAAEMPGAMSESSLAGQTANRSELAHTAPQRETRTRPSRRALAGGVALLLAIVAIASGSRLKAPVEADQTQGLVPVLNSVAVLPFLDLTTQAMNEEYFADGMTEELIGDLSRLPGFRVPSPTASFYFKDKPAPVAEIARQLRVTYVIDGSVRKAGSTFRVAARMLRADDGYVVWTETYDRPFGDVLAMQKEIAARMTTSLHAAMGAAVAKRPSP